MIKWEGDEYFRLLHICIMAKKIIAIIISSLLFIANASAFKAVDCKTSPSFGDLSCDLCFEWKSVSVWEDLWVLQDTVVNTTPYDIYIDLKDQTDPFISDLETDLVKWKQLQDNESLWKYAPEAEKYYDKDLDAYIVPSWDSVVLTRSNFGWSYALEKNELSEWDEVGMVVFPISIRNLDSEWNLGDKYEHRQCVLYTWNKGGTVTPPSTETSTPDPLPETDPELTPTPEIPEETPKEELKEPDNNVTTDEFDPTEVPTGPEHVLILMLTLLLASIIIIRKKA